VFKKNLIFLHPTFGDLLEVFTTKQINGVNFSFVKTKGAKIFFCRDKGKKKSVTISAKKFA